MPGSVVRLGVDHVALISNRASHVMQANISGVLELGDVFLSLRAAGEVVTVLLPEGAAVTDAPDGWTFAMLGGEYRLGDVVECAGGYVDASSYLVPSDVYVAEEAVLVALQDERRPPGSTLARRFSSFSRRRRA